MHFVCSLQLHVLTLILYQEKKSQAVSLGDIAGHLIVFSIMGNQCLASANKLTNELPK